MSEQPKIKVLIAGATGYIGGSILAALIASNTNSQYSFSALIRDSTQAEKLENLGVRTLIFKGLDDLEVCEGAGSQHDVVINAASSSHPDPVRAWVRGLSKRQRDTGKECFFVQTGGTSILGDQPISKKFVDTKIYSDKEDIYGYEVEREKRETYGQRVADIATVKIGEEMGVKTYIIIPPTIYGRGTGPFNVVSQQIPNIIRYSLKIKQAVVIGDGLAHWNHVHVADLADLYVLFLSRLFGPTLSSPELPYGKTGIYFAETGEHTWLDVSQAIAKAAKSQNLIPSDGVKHLTLKEAAEAFMGGDESFVEIVLASNSRSKAEKARELVGWKPKFEGNDDRDFGGSFEFEVRVVSQEGGGKSASYPVEQFTSK